LETEILGEILIYLPVAAATILAAEEMMQTSRWE
jgi:hypothetical protein